MTSTPQTIIHPRPDPIRIEPIGADEWTAARLTPPCIVQDYLYSDVGVLIAPGGTGKTTLLLYEAAHIVLGLPLYGLEVLRPGPVGILTAEDSREMLVARLRRIAEALGLNPAQVTQVREQVRILDVSGTGTRLTEVRNDVVIPSPYVGELAEALHELEPALVTIDPAVSFGVGETRVNDAEQGLIEAGRRLRRALDCCVRYIHHSGKANAREGATDQYAGRGGSAFADGARMVHVLQSVAPADWNNATGTELEPGDSGLILARPKMSYCPPQGEIYLHRRGYEFGEVAEARKDPTAALERDARTLLHIIDITDRPTRNRLEAMDTGLTRARLRQVVSALLEDGRLVQRETGAPNGARYYLAVASPHTSGEPHPNKDRTADEVSPPRFAAAYRERDGGEPPAALYPSAPTVRRRPAAKRREAPRSDSGEAHTGNHDEADDWETSL